MYAKSNKYLGNGAKCGYYRPLEESDTWTISIIASVKDLAQVPFKVFTYYYPKDPFPDCSSPPQGKGHSSPHFSANVYCGQTVAHLSNC